MSSLLSRLLPDTPSCDLAIRVVVLVLDQIDVVGMHAVACDVRDLVRAFRVSCDPLFSSMHHNGFLVAPIECPASERITASTGHSNRAVGLCSRRRTGLVRLRADSVSIFVQVFSFLLFNCLVQDGARVEAAFAATFGPSVLKSSCATA
jgi:hypothetical protein